MLKNLILTILFLFVMAGSVFAQGNDFPFYPGVPPPNQPFVPGPTPGQPNYRYGTAWSSGPLYGVQKGSTVYFDVVMDWWGFARVGLSPMSDQGNDFKYLNPTDGTASQEQQWWWPDIGYFCFRCQWSFNATEDNPTLRLEFIGSDYFGAHLEVTYVEPPPPPPPFQWTGPFLTQENKTRAGELATVGSAVASASAVGGMITCATGNFGACGIYAGVGLASAFASLWFDRIAQDPWDPGYQYPYDWEIDGYQAELMSQYCYQTGDDEYLWSLCWSIRDLQLSLDAALRGAAITADRLESCNYVGDPCGAWQHDIGINYLRTAGYYMFYTGLYYQYFHDYLVSIGYNDEADSVGYLGWIASYYTTYYDTFLYAN